MAARRAQRYHVYWTDRSVTRTRVACLGEHQLINHYPGMLALTSKSQLAMNLRKMQELHPDEYDFVPQSWLLPEDLPAFQRECRRVRKAKDDAMFIVKPESVKRHIKRTRTHHHARHKIIAHFMLCCE